MKSATFLQLAPEFGGTKFGPFQGGEIRLGSDPASNDISIPADLGVLPQHVKILQQNDTSFIVAPTDRTATVYIWRQGKTKPKQIVTPMAVQIGDGFSLVSPEGHRFYIVSEALKRDKESAGTSFKDKAMKRMPTSRGLFEEVKRRGFAKVFTTRLGNSLMYAYRFVSTGQIFSPMYIIAGIMMLSSVFLTSGATCTAFSLNGSLNTYREDLQECRDQMSGTSDGQGRPTVSSLTKLVLDANGWDVSVRDDAQLRQGYVKNLIGAFSQLQSNFYRTSYSGRDKQFDAFARAMKRNAGEDFSNTMMGLAAPDSKVGTREWRLVEDSEGEEVCGRGPLGLTYRQAKNLGLENVQLDALVKETVALSQNIPEKQAALRRTAEAANETDVSFAGMVLKDSEAPVSDVRYCLHVDGPDDRTDIGALAKALRAKIGVNAPGLPQQNMSHWLAYRLYKVAAMDFITYADIADFNDARPPSLYLSGQGVSDKRIAYASNYAGRVMARSVVLRCGARLDKELQDSPPEHLGKLPELHHCATLKTYVDYNLVD